MRRPFLEIGRQPDAVIPHSNERALALGLHCHAHRAHPAIFRCRKGMLECIGQQLVQNQAIVDSLLGRYADPRQIILDGYLARAECVAQFRCQHAHIPAQVDLTYVL